MPTQRRRWTAHTEEQRAGTDAAALRTISHHEAAQTLIAQARQLLRDPVLAEQLLADASAAISRGTAEQERIRRLMLEARVGID